MTAPAITILVGYHKPAPVIRNGILTPIRLGAATAAPIAPSGDDHARAREGERERERERAASPAASPEQEAAFEAMPGDDTGEHISPLNRQLCEMTAAYWAWKNYAALGAPDYFGLAHYRRLLAFDDRDKRPRILIASPGDAAAALFSERAIRALVPRYDICVPAPLPVALETPDGAVRYCSVWDQYAAVHNAGDLAAAFSAAASLYPEYADSVREYSRSYKSYLFNMFVMRKDLFLHYARWIFSILFTVNKDMRHDGASAYQQRTLSFLSERLTGLFIWRLLKARGIRAATLPSIHIGC